MKRIRTKTSGSSGGISPVIADVAWGPDFGEGNGNDNNTWTVSAAVDFANQQLISDKTINAAVDFASLSLTNDKTVNAAVDFSDLTLINNKTINAAVDFSNQTLISDQTISAAVDITNLALINDKTVSVALAGTYSSAPTWLAEAHNAGTSAAATDLTINVPSGTVDGNLMIAFICCNGVGASITPPAGWTLEEEVTTTPFLECYSRVASSEPASYDWAIGGTTLNFAGGIHLIKGFDTGDPTDIDGQGTGSAVDPVAPSVTTTGINRLVIGCVVHAPATTETFTPPAGWTERWDQAGGTVTPVCQSSATRQFASAGATGAQTYNGTTLAAAQYSAITVAISPGTISLPS